jgi:hypothetical protein
MKIIKKIFEAIIKRKIKKHCGECDLFMESSMLCDGWGEVITEETIAECDEAAEYAAELFFEIYEEEN